MCRAHLVNDPNAISHPVLDNVPAVSFPGLIATRMVCVALPDVTGITNFAENSPLVLGAAEDAARLDRFLAAVTFESFAPLTWKREAATASTDLLVRRMIFLTAGSGVSAMSNVQLNEAARTVKGIEMEQMALPRSASKRTFIVNLYQR